MRAAVVVVVLSLATLTACGRHVYSRDDLTVSLGKHHIDLRWGRIGNAAGSVKPEMREAFMREWTTKTASIELQEIDVSAVVVTPDGDAADVMVNITYVDKQSMTVKTEAISERWIRTEDGWMAEKPATLGVSESAAPVDPMRPSHDADAFGAAPSTSPL